MNNREISTHLGADPATCAHEWEPHLWEAATDYCPYCGAMRPSETEEETKR